MRGETSVSLRMPRSLGVSQLLAALSDDPVPPATADRTTAVGEPLPAQHNTIHGRPNKRATDLTTIILSNLNRFLPRDAMHPRY